MRGSVMVTHRTHIPESPGSIPGPATISEKAKEYILQLIPPIIGIATVVISAVSGQASTSSHGWDPINGKTQWDQIFEQETSRYFANKHDWKMFRQQVFKESSFNPRAVSPVGAQGLSQFLPTTWSMVQTEKPELRGRSAFVPEFAISGQMYYMDKLISKWISDRTDDDRIKWGLASYNAGFGTLLKAQRNCEIQIQDRDCNKYDDIKQFLPEETINYVNNITDPFLDDKKEKEVKVANKEEGIYEILRKLNYVEIGLIRAVVEYILKAKGEGE